MHAGVFGHRPQTNTCREHIVKLLPQISSLNGQAVSAADREAAARCVAQTQAMLAMMVANACTVHKLVRTGRCLAIVCYMMPC